ncbi:hypothetical protein WJX72_004967 [[Myrmecia] bisecta]|uniref:Photolyase/cryptochrome alpha/beta domain-containing protein n=1 Tax=[Myrmecia] bisecta TaxID=41462 RepID=A0AAW1PNP1_9CHLO
MAAQILHARPVVRPRHPTLQFASSHHPTARTHSLQDISRLQRSTAPSGLPRQVMQASSSASAPQPDIIQELQVQGSGPILVWYKHDLRVDDHPGLHMALQAKRPIVPVFCFDAALYSQLLRTPAGLQALVAAVAALRQSLRDRGTDLIIRSGPLASILPSLVQACNASAVITEEEVEFRWVRALMECKELLPPAVPLTTWRLSLFESSAYCESYERFKAGRGQPLPPLQAPGTMPKCMASLDLGNLPDLHQLRMAVEQEYASSTSEEVQQMSHKLEESEPWRAAVAQALVGGEAQAGRAFQYYLRSQEAGSPPQPSLTGPSQGAEDAEFAAIRGAVAFTEKPASPFGSFPAIFAQAMWGQRAQQGLTARAAAAAAKAADFHWHLATADRFRDTKTGGAPRHWRWRGFLTDYYTAEPDLQNQRDRADVPAFLLVHGFGAFGEQWRGQIRALAAQGYRVYAPTIPGYGRSEKPALAYSQDLWRDFLRDFVVDVVRRPVLVVGNSIGGYMAASLAGDCKPLVKGLVLLNSAGFVDPEYSPPPALPLAGKPLKQGPPKVLVDLISKALFLYLQSSVAKTLLKLYPVDPANADGWLAEEILRASSDPGAIGVFRSVFYLPRPRPINYVIQDLWGGPTLVLNGRKDPLNNAVKRAESLQAACSNVEVKLLDAGHCPHDERPEEVNRQLLQFMAETVLRQQQSVAELVTAC